MCEKEAEHLSESQQDDRDVSQARSIERHGDLAAVATLRAQKLCQKFIAELETPL